MHDDGSISFRAFFGWVAMVVGAWIGCALVEWGWRSVNQGFYRWQPRPERGWGYAALSIICALSVAAVALALVRFRDLPNDD